MLKGKCPHGASQVDIFGYFSDCPCRTAENNELAQQHLTKQGGFEDSTKIYPRCPQCDSSAWFEAEFNQLRCAVCGRVIAGKLPPC